jgi:hypothetical protein
MGDAAGLLVRINPEMFFPPHVYTILYFAWANSATLLDLEHGTAAEFEVAGVKCSVGSNNGAVWIDTHDRIFSFFPKHRAN